MRDKLARCIVPLSTRQTIYVSRYQWTCLWCILNKHNLRRRLISFPTQIPLCHIMCELLLCSTGNMTKDRLPDLRLVRIKAQSLLPEHTTYTLHMLSQFYTQKSCSSFELFIKHNITLKIIHQRYAIFKTCHQIMITEASHKWS